MILDQCPVLAGFLNQNKSCVCDGRDILFIPLGIIVLFFNVTLLLVLFFVDSINNWTNEIADQCPNEKENHHLKQNTVASSDKIYVINIHDDQKELSIKAIV